MRIENLEDRTVVYAENGNVLCDGTSCTSVNGRVTAPVGSDVSEWKEMPLDEALAIIEEAEEEVTEEDYIEALNELGATFDEEE